MGLSFNPNHKPAVDLNALKTSQGAPQPTSTAPTAPAEHNWYVKGTKPEAAKPTDDTAEIKELLDKNEVEESGIGKTELAKQEEANKKNNNDKPQTPQAVLKNLAGNVSVKASPQIKNLVNKLVESKIKLPSELREKLLTGNITAQEINSFITSSQIIQENPEIAQALSQIAQALQDERERKALTKNDRGPKVSPSTNSTSQKSAPPLREDFTLQGKVESSMLAFLKMRGPVDALEKLGLSVGELKEALDRGIINKSQAQLINNVANSNQKDEAIKKLMLAIVKDFIMTGVPLKDPGEIVDETKRIEGTVNAQIS